MIHIESFSFMKYTHGHILPLVGGSVVGTTMALQTQPSWIASWKNIFEANDSYCLKYMDGVPYYDFDENPPMDYVDIVTSLPPCAGLSLANQSNGKSEKSSNHRGCSAPSNVHMFNAALHSVTQIKPKVLMVENAPGLFTKMGEEFAERLNALANEHGYTMSLVKTSSIRHGVPQREHEVSSFSGKETRFRFSNRFGANMFRITNSSEEKSSRDRSCQHRHGPSSERESSLAVSSNEIRRLRTTRDFGRARR